MLRRLTILLTILFVLLLPNPVSAEHRLNFQMSIQNTSTVSAEIRNVCVESCQLGQNDFCIHSSNLLK